MSVGRIFSKDPVPPPTSATVRRRFTGNVLGARTVASPEGIQKGRRVYRNVLTATEFSRIRLDSTLVITLT